jgi:hypothetical protein
MNMATATTNTTTAATNPAGLAGPIHWPRRFAPTGRRIVVDREKRSATRGQGVAQRNPWTGCSAAQPVDAMRVRIFAPAGAKETSNPNADFLRPRRGGMNIRRDRGRLISTGCASPSGAASPVATIQRPAGAKRAIHSVNPSFVWMPMPTSVKFFLTPQPPRSTLGKSAICARMGLIPIE